MEAALLSILFGGFPFFIFLPILSFKVFRLKLQAFRTCLVPLHRTVSTVATNLNVVIAALRLLADIIQPPEDRSPSGLSVLAPTSAPSRLSATRTSITWAPCGSPGLHPHLWQPPSLEDNRAPPSPASSARSDTPPTPPIFLLPTFHLPSSRSSSPHPRSDTSWDDDWSAKDDDLLLSLKCNERLRPSWRYVAHKMQRPLSQIQACWADLLELQRLAASRCSLLPTPSPAHQLDFISSRFRIKRQRRCFPTSHFTSISRCFHCPFVFLLPSCPYSLSAQTLVSLVLISTFLRRAR